MERTFVADGTKSLEVVPCGVSGHLRLDYDIPINHEINLKVGAYAQRKKQNLKSWLDKYTDLVRPDRGKMALSTDATSSFRAIYMVFPYNFCPGTANCSIKGGLKLIANLHLCW